MDSTVLLAQAVGMYGKESVHALSVLYGQRHRRELQSATDIVNHYGCGYEVCNIESAMRPLFAGAGSSQVGKLVDVPHGHYTAENMKLTIVPNRNMLLIAIAGAYAAAFGEQACIYYAAHAGDHAIYPDCRPEFADAMTEALQRGNDPGIELVRPFIDKTKTDICEIGAELGVPFELTWSCYDPQESGAELIHCGQCGTCVERKEAFRDSMTPDPTEYNVA